MREKSREFQEQHEKNEKAHNDVESVMNVSINNLQSEIENIKAAVAKHTEEKKKLERRLANIKTMDEKIKREAEVVRFGCRWYIV